jgi:hypothetical protein
MDIKALAELILDRQKEKDATIIEIFKTGSQIFLDRKKDYDFVIICKNYNQRRTREVVEENGLKYDIIIIDENAVKASMDFNNLFYVHKDIKLFNYLFEKNIRQTIYGNFELDWSMLQHKEDYLGFIKERFNKTNYDILKDPWRVGKSFVHYYVILKIYENNKVELTEEIINNVSLLYGSTIEAKPIIDWIFNKLK